MEVVHGSCPVLLAFDDLKLNFSAHKMSVAVIQGASGGLGSAFTRHLLRNTSLKAYAITHRSKSELGWNPHEDLTQGQRDRLIMLDGVDSTQEEALVKVQKEVSDREGNGSVRLIACFAGVVSHQSTDHP